LLEKLSSGMKHPVAAELSDYMIRFQFLVNASNVYSIEASERDHKRLLLECVISEPTIEYHIECVKFAYKIAISNETGEDYYENYIKLLGSEYEMIEHYFSARRQRDTWTRIDSSIEYSDSENPKKSNLSYQVFKVKVVGGKIIDVCF